jgi:hypothetical protein
MAHVSFTLFCDGDFSFIDHIFTKISFVQKLVKTFDPKMIKSWLPKPFVDLWDCGHDGVLCCDYAKFFIGFLFFLFVCLKKHFFCIIQYYYYC